MTAYQRRSRAIPTRSDHTLDAAGRASRLRRELGFSATEPVSPVDIALRKEIEVRFCDDFPRLEGMYVPGVKPVILVSSLRPAGRQAFTAAHELGHYVFGHPGHIFPLDLDQVGEEQANQKSSRKTPEEIQADAFAASLLMPRLGVQQAFYVRGLSYDSCNAEDIYNVAWFFGVGYDTLIRHLTFTLKLLSKERAEGLRREKPKDLRASLLGKPTENDVIVVDTHWTGTRAVDTQVGDVALLAPGLTVDPESRCTKQEAIHGKYTQVLAKEPGITRIVHASADWAVHLRVCRKKYAGLARYRHLEEEEEDA